MRSGVARGLQHARRGARAARRSLRPSARRVSRAGPTEAAPRFEYAGQCAPPGPVAFSRGGGAGCQRSGGDAQHLGPNLALWRSRRQSYGPMPVCMARLLLLVSGLGRPSAAAEMVGTVEICSPIGAVT